MSAGSASGSPSGPGSGPGPGPGPGSGPGPSSGSRRSILTEACLATLAVAVVIGAIEGLARVSPFIAGQGGAFVAVAFLAVPLWVARWRRLPGDPLGLDGHLGRGVALGLVASAVVLVPFALGFHLLQTEVRGYVLGGPGLRAPPAEFDGRPDPLPTVGAAVYRHERGLAVENGSRVVFRVEPLCHSVTSAGPGRPLAETAALAVDCTVRDLAPGGVVVLGSDAAAAFRVRNRQGHEVPVVSGQAAIVLTQPVEAPSGFTWLGWLLLGQVVVVAFPEEVFFRGYVQQRLRSVLPPRRRLFGVPFGLAHVLGALLFALVHLVAVPSPHRLLVFFPGLVFAWLGERSGSVVAPAVHHALANLALAVLQRLYAVGR